MRGRVWRGMARPGWAGARHRSARGIHRERFCLLCACGYHRLMSTLEERVAHLEQQAAERLDAQVDAGLHAVAFGVSLVQADVAELKGQVVGLRGEVAEVREQIAGLDESLNAKLDAILERLQD